MTILLHQVFYCYGRSTCQVEKLFYREELAHQFVQKVTGDPDYHIREKTVKTVDGLYYMHHDSPYISFCSEGMVRLARLQLSRTREEGMGIPCYTTPELEALARVEVDNLNRECLNDRNRFYATHIWI